MKVYDCWWIAIPETNVGVQAKSRNKAKSITFRKVRDAYDCARYTDIRARLDPCAKVHYDESGKLLTTNASQNA